jgi:predicted lipoprotein with Yx(FWY)xxD motif
MRSARWLIAAIRLSPVARRQSMLSAACGLAVLTALAVVGCGGPAPAGSAGAAGNNGNPGNAGAVGNAGTVADASRPATGRAAASADDEDDEQKIPPRGPIVVQAQKDARGVVLTDAAGFTLYTFSADGPLAPRCTGQCAARWRPATGGGGKPQAGTGVSAADIGSVRRDDGSFQVTYRTAPLYYFAGDAKAGDRNGADRDEFGGRFRCVPPADTDKS